MPIMPLDSPEEWGWDTDTQQLLVRFRERQPDAGGAPPTREAIVRLNVANVNVRNIPPVTYPPPPPEDA